MVCLTLVMAGIQIAWSVELAYISPYLLSLGVRKSALSLIWVAGPVSGVVVQPLVGMLSDRVQFRWGRRRVFIGGSTAAVVVGFIGMGRTREIMQWWSGRERWEDVGTGVIALAVASLILLDLAINASTPPRSCTLLERVS
jgi:solute carrier family 45 protein 1/2/4